MQQPQNPIVPRIQKLTEHWQKFTSSENGQVCRWHAQMDEVQMIDAFYKVETEESGETKDLFLKFSAPFEDSNSYSQLLSEELQAHIERDRDELEKEGIHVQWTPPSSVELPSSPLSFLQNLDTFAHSLDDFLTDGYLIAYLAPQDMSHPAHWESWLIDAVKYGIPERVKLMILDTVDNPCFDRLNEQFPDEVILIRPELNMSSAMQQIAARGNPRLPDVKFRRAFVGLTQASVKGNINGLSSMSKRALGIARMHKWPHLEVATLMTVAGAYLGKKQFDQALSIYRQAEQVTKRSYPPGNKLGASLAVNVALAQGAAHIAAKDFQQAAAVFEKAVPMAEQSGNHFFQMEAWRMAGYCHEQNKDYEKAWQCHNKALNTAALLDGNMQKNSTVPFIGQSLLRLVPKFGKHEDELEIRRRIQSMVGSNWETKLRSHVRI